VMRADDVATRLLLTITLAATPACTAPEGAGPDHGAAATTDARADAACLALLAAMPDQWPERLAPVHALGAAVVPRLVAHLRDQPLAPGARAAVALFGRIDSDAAVPFLSEAVADGSPLAVEAALALGDLRAHAAAPTLVATVADANADPTLRTAAACAAVQLGKANDVAPFLRAVMLAGSPAGQEPGAAFGLPVRPRWALERYLVQRLLLHEGEVALAREFDTDLSWPQLLAATDRVCQWLTRRGG
jgi:HEAT repeat protein